MIVASAAVAQPPAENQPSARQPTQVEHHAGSPVTSPGASEQSTESDGGQAGAATMDLEAIEAELDLLVSKMNDSAGESKIEAIAKLLETLVRQHRAVCAAPARPHGGAAADGCCQGMRRGVGETSGTRPAP
jgi:hypothetical protein